MSEENVDLVRRAFQAFNDRDFAALASTYSEGVVMRIIGGFEALTGPEFRGRDVVLDFWRDTVDTIGGQADIEMIREVGDQVVVVVNAVGVGAASGASASMRFGHVYSFGSGHISRIDGYFDADDALKAVALAE
jgi:ketosteroid isomerase-like protein